jgi:hypothetical protein
MVEYITYKGEKYPVRIAWSTIKALETVENLNAFEKTELALYCGLVSGHKAEDKEMPFKAEEIQFLLDECVDEFNAIFQKQAVKAKENSEGDKKK